MRTPDIFRSGLRWIPILLATHSNYVYIFREWNVSSHDHVLEFIPGWFLIHLASSLCGCFGVLSFAYIFNLAVRSRIFDKIGTFSKDIMTLHLLSFVIVDLIISGFGYYYGSISASTHESIRVHGSSNPTRGYAHPY